MLVYVDKEVEVTVESEGVKLFDVPLFGEKEVMDGARGFVTDKTLPPVAVAVARVSMALDMEVMLIVVGDAPTTARSWVRVTESSCCPIGQTVMVLSCMHKQGESL